MQVPEHLGQLEEAVREQRYSDATALQERIKYAERWVEVVTEAGAKAAGTAVDEAGNCSYIYGHDWAEGHSSGTPHPASTKEACCALCAKTATCAASVFEPPSNCYYKTANDLKAGLAAVPKKIYACVPPGVHPIPAGPPAPPGPPCDNKPQPCPNTHGRTFCPNVHRTDQCASPVRPKPC